MIDIRDDAGKLLMRYDPVMDMIEVQRRGIKTIINLKQYKESAMNAMSSEEELTQIKRCLLENFIKAGSPVTLEMMTYDFCRELIKDIALNYTTLKSAMSAARQQGGADGRRNYQ